jgi:hypothetical protein
MGPMTTNTTYRQHHIHTLRLISGVWVASVVAPGGNVEHLRGDFPTHEDAVKGAKQSIDRTRAERASP